MGIINLLDISVANLIAAGEVVERPASAIKELLENSIDAGATKITAEIKNGGTSLIRITDNGCGMSRDDALVCTQRHATSKIKDASDLDGIVTLGFRGEALAAISSVSNMRIMTKTSGSEVGTVIECLGGRVTSVEDAGCPCGTTVIVEELFANVPARRKFLRRDATETAAVAAVLEKLALSRPDISIKFIADGNVKFQTSGDGSLRNVIYSVLGRDFANKMVDIHDETDGIEVDGYVGTPENCRGNRNYENFFINGRYVKCKTAAAAIEQAFSSYIPSDKFPACVIRLNINPAFVDVNVHPQKMEVKFSNEKPVFNAVYCAVRNALMTKINRPTLGGDKTKLTGDSYRLYSDIMGMKTDSDEEAEKIANEKERLSFKYEQITVPRPVHYPNIKDGVVTLHSGSDIPNSQVEPKNDSKKAESYREQNILGTQHNGDTQGDIEAYGRYTGINHSSDSQSSNGLCYNQNESRCVQICKPQKTSQYTKAEGDISYKTQPLSSEQNKPGDSYLTEDSKNVATKENAANIISNSFETGSDMIAELPDYRIAGVMFECYIFVELSDKMLIIDKHAAHERVLFEGLKANMKKTQPMAQLLILPLELKLTQAEHAAVIEYREELSKIGYDFLDGDEMGTVDIYKYPLGLTSKGAVDMFCELAFRISEGIGDVGVSRDIICEKALYQASCKAAVKGGRGDSEENIKWIVEQVLSRDDIRYCPHGRPVAFEMTKAQFEKRFERT